MSSNDILLDSSFIFALNSPKDKNNKRAIEFVKLNTESLLLPQITLPEVTFLLMRAGGLPAVRGFLKRLVLSQALLTPLVLEDLERAEQIMATYSDANFDFVDA
jgi:predicted nucleic acid-binding protein